MKNILKVAGALAVMVALTQSLQATPISGSIGFDGGVTFNNGSAGLATEVTAWISPSTSPLPPTGAFSTVSPNTPVTFTSSIWNLNTSTAINNFWTVGGFTFELLSSSITSQGGTIFTGPNANGFVDVSGMGIVSGNGYTPTSMSWSFSSQDPKVNSSPDTWTFSASAASTPDGGATVMLLGIALSGVALIRRKLTA